MSLGRWSAAQIYLYRYPVDMRKGTDALTVLINQEMALDPQASILFVFLNRGKDKLKMLKWERNGFWVLYKKLLRQKFKWPDWFDADQLILSESQLLQLLDGYDLNGMRPHEVLCIKHFS